MPLDPGTTCEIRALMLCDHCLARKMGLRRPWGVLCQIPGCMCALKSDTRTWSAGAPFRAPPWRGIHRS